MSAVLVCHEDAMHVPSSVDVRVVTYGHDCDSFDLKDILSAQIGRKVRYLGIHVERTSEKLLVFCENDWKNNTSSLHALIEEVAESFVMEDGYIDFLTIGNIAVVDSVKDSLFFMNSKVKLRYNFENGIENRRISDIYSYSHEVMTQSSSSAHLRYERIKIVGKGAFGSAILYRKKDDETLVIIKEINMYELDSSQRQLALNEVSLLSRIDHPNIIAYYDSFEEDGVLMIEMEYADGGTLAQLLSKCEGPLDEDFIIEMTIQMLSAVSYLHENSVLHRDLKTANIFLTKDSFVKIGDFGISKMMGTETLAQGAKTVVGTPYYISPEMCSGMTYNEKSDMWALGCIIYEMMCLKKAFEGDNLPALVNNIMNCSYAPVRGNFGAELKLLVRELLQLNPQHRPSATQSLKMLRPTARTHERTSMRATSSGAKVCSVYLLDTSTITLTHVPKLPPRLTVEQISISETHVLILTKDNTVIAFGENRHGQLGTGDTLKTKPSPIALLKGRDVQSVAAGNGFSVVCCDRGTLLTFGRKCCVGLGTLAGDVLKPTLLESLLRDHIKEVVCGFEHVIAITEAGECYAWGDGSDGKLGTGAMQHCSVPTKIAIPSAKRIATGKAGKDCTLLLSDDGFLIAMGSNRFNKLNLAKRQGFFAKERNDNSECIMKPTILKAFPERVVDFHVGTFHTGVILESGQVILFGRNMYGELGHCHTQPVGVGIVKPVKSLLHHACNRVVCGDGFTLASTTEHELFFWGMKKVALNHSSKHSLIIEDLESSSVFTIDGQRNLGSKHPVGLAEMPTHDIIPLPSLILRLQDGRSDKGIRLAALVSAGDRILVVVESSEGKRLPSALLERKRDSAPNLDDSFANTWIRNELNQAEYIPIDKSKQKKQRKGSGDDESSNDSGLLKEIEVLKQKIKEQNTTFEGHRVQMGELQEKLAELQARQSYMRKSEPPPAYNERKAVTHNQFFPENQSKTCCIL